MTVRRRLLLIEDNADIANLIRRELEDQGHEITWVTDGTTGLARARQQSFHLILLDLGLPDLDGMDVLKRLRRATTLPIIILSGRSDPSEIAHLLLSGANDYLVKPFDWRELLARINVQLRERGPQPLRVGELIVHVDQRRATLKNQELHLSNKEFDLLALLATQPGRVFSRERIEQELWGNDRPVSATAMDVHLTNLRGKFRALQSRDLIRTVRGVGFTLRS